MVKDRIIVVACHLNIGRTKKVDFDVLQPMAGLQIASLIDTNKYDVELYHEITAGPLNTKKLLEDAKNGKCYKMAIFTGLQKDFDRMRQLSYFFRRTDAITVAGGGICTLYPEQSLEYFDVVCSGNVDSILTIMHDYENSKLRKTYFSNGTEKVKNRVYHDFMNRNKIKCHVHLIETSRGCNYKCGFCTLPGENSKHVTYDLDVVIKNIEDSLDNAPFLSVKNIYPHIHFIDNHFSINKEHFHKICDYLKSNKKVKGWSALVSQNILSNKELIDKMADSKCQVLFTGIESLDEAFLEKNKKKQNLTSGDNLLEDIDYVQRKGILVTYGWLFDPRLNTVEQMREQVDKLLQSDILLFPSFFSVVSPLLGTDVFDSSLQKGELRNGLLLRDLDGMTIAYNNCIEDDETLSAFAKIVFETPRKLVNIISLFKKSIKYIIKYRVRDPLMLITVIQGNFRAFRQATITTNRVFKDRNFIGGKDKLDPQYSEYPSDISSDEYERYFKPIKLKENDGSVPEWLNRETFSKKVASAGLSKK